jgi:hypothetical protein
MDSAECVSTRPTIAVYSAVIGGGTSVTEFVEILKRNGDLARAAYRADRGDPATHQPSARWPLATEGAPDRPPPHNGRPLNQLSHHRQLPLRNNRSDENLTVNWRAHCRELIRTSQPAPCRTAGCDSTPLLGTSNLVAGRVLAVAVIAVATSITVASCARTVAGTCAYPATTWRATRRTGRRRWPDRLCSARLDVPISV